LDTSADRTVQPGTIARNEAMQPVAHNRIIVLGGGLAGLSASLHCGAPVYEADQRCGGVAASDRSDGFTFDRGIHILQTNNTKVLELLADLGVDFRLHKRNAHIYSHRAYTPYPFQVNTAGLPLGVRLNCLWRFFRRDAEPEPSNYEEWIYKNLGRGFGDTFLIPYSTKFWTVHPREMTFEWTGGRVPQPSPSQVVRGALWSKQTAIGTNAIFRYPRNELGYGAIASAIERRLAKVHRGHRATRLDTGRRVVVFNGGITVPYDVLISTIPLPDLVRITVDAPGAVRNAASRLRTNSIIVVNLGIRRPDLSHRHWVHFPESDVSFFRISYPHTFGEGMAPAGMSSISTEVAYSDAAPVDKGRIVDRVIADLIRVRALSRDDKIEFVSTRDIPYAYCIYDQQRASAVKTIISWLREQNVVPAGRYGLWTYFWGDEAILSGKKAAEQALAIALRDDVRGIQRGA
jgi:protoporphyrinogen oxidase